MAEFKISRIRYTWKGGWITSTSYNKDDVVRYGGSTWVCVRQHTSGAFQSDQEYLANISDTDPTPAWIKMTDGYSWRSVWNVSVLYNPGDIVLYAGTIYLCIQSHTSAPEFATNATKFTVYVSLVNWADDWAPTTRYGVGDVIRYNGNLYICKVEHTSSTTADGIEVGNNDADDDSSGEYWDLYYEGIQYTGYWTDGTRYRQNDLIKYGGSILRCITGHTAVSAIDNGKFEVEFPGLNFNDSWNISSHYAVGDMVRHGGYIFVANFSNFGISPITSIYNQPSLDNTWSLLTRGIKFRGDWSVSETYKVGDVVRRGGYIFVCLIDTEVSSEDGSTLDYLDSSNWETIVPGINWRGSWTINSTYELGDLIQFKGSTYKANYSHISDNDNFPGDNGSGFYYWDLVLLSGDNVGLQNRGDLLTYDLTRSQVGDGSTFGATSVPIGIQNQLLMVDPEGSLGYEEFARIPKFLYVDQTDGVDDFDDLDRGITPFKPLRTVRFACERAEELGSDLTMIKVATGVYDEVLPIIVPAGTTVGGDELRSTTIRPLPANPALAGDSPYHFDALDRISDIIQDILTLTPITKSTGNTETQVTSLTTLENVSYSPPQYSDAGNTIEIYQPISVYTAPRATAIQTMINDITAYINFYVNGTGSEPALVSTNSYTYSPAIENSLKILTANKNFIAAEIVAYIRTMHPIYTFDQTLLSTMIKRYVNAFKYDLKYVGHYKILLEARYYKNQVLGSKTEDMFYFRNSTGLKNLSVKGLQGTLNPPNVFELYQRPTGGAYCSLDPGWGPNDNRTWITSRSPYIQNVTTFGENCIGQKIDGALHNGGNKSMVSNDFTQVISDGIGAWVLNNGRAELVSVFTYYAQIGMFAERGGVIRATNGNSSYGNFGSLADGNDPTEVPRFAEVDNRNNEAVVASAFAGEVNDEILILEYANAGENYSQATYTFTGSGTQASVIQEEFRDNAIFEALIKNAPGDSGGTEGAGGYFILGNNAQVGNTTSLTLASNDSSEEAVLLGLRLIITSGKGAGQYGYVTSYNPVSKVCTVSRESDDQPGWDHVIPGTPSQPSLFTDNTYRFEPRPIFSDPGFNSSTVALPSSDTSINVVYGETTETYTAISGNAGAGVVDGVTPITAEFTVVKNGRKYDVTMTNPGAGYATQQVITLDGAELGGLSGEHDVVITVTSISEDSTNSIQTFEYVGTAQSGRFIVTRGASDNIGVSIDGTTWTASQLPTSGNWKCLASGNNRFVAIRYLSNVAATSNDGITWTARSMPGTQRWNSVVYGGGIFVAVAGNGDAGAFSKNNGATWISTTLPNIGDSTFNEWVDIAYGRNRFVAVANSGNFVAVGEYNSVTDTIDWETHIMDVIEDSSTKDWQSIAWGNNRFVAVSGTGEIAYSFDGIDWLAGTMPTQDGSTAHFWRNIRYGQGVFLALGSTGARVIGADLSLGPTTFAATSYDGVNWTERTLSATQNWIASGFGNPDITLGDSTTQSNSTGMWVAVSEDSTANASKILTGARALGRVIVEGGNISQIRLWEPGSGYTNQATISIVDPNNTSDAYVEIRMGDAVLAQPSWINRGSGYRTSSTVVTLAGDGFADIIPNAENVTISGLEILPGPGAQFRFRGATDFYTVTTVALESTEPDGTLTGRFQISPSLTLDDFLEHTSQVEIRERYSQVRITGHDFLDIGTGNFVDTNYPTIYSAAEPYVYAEENEVVELNGGRVFYTSTDQSGNFRCGELFAVEQATGIVTISAQFFDLQGLTELALGGVRLGGSGAVVREFSTDPAFTADSNNIVPTQRAIKSYLQNRLNVGGSDLLTASFIAGTVRVGPNQINNVAGLEIKFPVRANFAGTAQISGSIMAQTMFFRSFDQG